MIVREWPTSPSNFRAGQSLDAWLRAHNLPAISIVDTRSLTRHIRENGAPNGVIAVNYEGKFDREALIELAQIARPEGNGSGQKRHKGCGGRLA